MSFDSFLLNHESAIRLGFFLGAFVLLAVWELFAPRRTLKRSRALRWTNNIALAAVNIVMVKVFFSLAAIGLAVFANEHGTGLFNMFPVPYPCAVVTSLLAFDLAVYVIHLAFHMAPGLWRIHRVHHADVDFDVATAVRFHPIQMMLSTLVKFAVILALGTPVLAVLAFEVLFHVLLLFNHANVRIPPAVDRVLRWFIVTPDMHRIHHSVHRAETDSNFGFALPWWDRLFGTYRAEPAAGHEQMTLGIGQFSEQRDFWLDRLLLNPFLDDCGSQIANRGEEADGYLIDAHNQASEGRTHLQNYKIDHTLVGESN
jgi:sterol desaturase/sphingolipid hydroxylase (fatty acid hydroxylase superfamily)